MDSYFKVARQAENNETDYTHENTTDINPVPNVAVTGVETALTCSENEPTTSLSNALYQMKID
jgi:hypothetical protein